MCAGPDASPCPRPPPWTPQCRVCRKLLPPDSLLTVAPTLEIPLPPLRLASSSSLRVSAYKSLVSTEERFLPFTPHSDYITRPFAAALSSCAFLSPSLSHITSEYGRMTDAERDQIDQDAQTFMRTCSEAIQQLRTQGEVPERGTQATVSCSVRQTLRAQPVKSRPLGSYLDLALKT